MFGPRFKIFRLAGFNVHVDLSWFLIAVLVTMSLANGVFASDRLYPGLADQPVARWTMGVVAMLLFFFSIVLHELAHALAARQFGIQMRGITLFIFGGVAEMSGDPPSAKAEFWVAIAGPIMSIVLGVLFLAASAIEQPLPSRAVSSWLGVINLILVVFNLIPAFPLDGGRVLRSALWAVSGNLRSATRITSRIGSAFGIILMVLGGVRIVFGDIVGGMWFVLVGMFLRQAAQMSYQQLLLRRALEGETVARFMKPDPITVHPETSIADVVNHYIYKHHHKLYPVTDNGHVVGCITTRRIKEVPPERWSELRAGEIAEQCSPSNTVRPETDAMEALSKMSRQGVSRLMVVDDRGGLAGVLTLKDLMRFMSLKVELEK